MFLPYVYIVRNRTNGKFYIGMRSANKVVAEQDLGTHYFTSSKHVKNNFTEFDIEIIAYFVDQISAFEFENDLIKKHWGNSLLLNRHYQKSMSKFSMTGSKREDLTEYNRKTKSKPKEERVYTCAICACIFTRLEFCHHPIREEVVCGHKCNGVRSGKKSLGKPNLKLRESLQGRPAWNKGQPNLTAAENGKKSAAKQSATVTGRKRKYLPDGKWTYEYPNK
jgi:hypothetical protein